MISAASTVRVSAQGGVPADSVSLALGTVLGNTIGGIIDEFEHAGTVVDRGIVAETALKVASGSYETMDLMRAQTIVNGILSAMAPIAGVDSFDTASQEHFLNEAAAREGAVRTPSGVVFEVITEGEGPMPAEGSSVRIFYVGRLSDDTIFDATDDPVVFPLDNLTPGLAEGLRMMRPGGKYRVTIPAGQAYGEYGIPGVIPGRAALQFVVELIDVIN